MRGKDPPEALTGQGTSASFVATGRVGNEDTTSAGEVYRAIAPRFVFGTLDAVAYLLSAQNPWRRRSRPGAASRGRGPLGRGMSAALDGRQRRSTATVSGRACCLDSSPLTSSIGATRGADAADAGEQENVLGRAAVVPALLTRPAQPAPSAARRFSNPDVARHRHRLHCPADHLDAEYSATRTCRRSRDGPSALAVPVHDACMARPAPRRRRRLQQPGPAHKHHLHPPTNSTRPSTGLPIHGDLPDSRQRRRPAYTNRRRASVAHQPLLPLPERSARGRAACARTRGHQRRPLERDAGRRRGPAAASRRALHDPLYRGHVEGPSDVSTAGGVRVNRRRRPATRRAHRTCKRRAGPA